MRSSTPEPKRLVLLLLGVLLVLPGCDFGYDPADHAIIVWPPRSTSTTRSP